MNNINYSDFFRYEDGKLFWKKRTSTCVKVGSEAGSLRPDGYVYIGLNKSSHYAHRIIWEMHNGYIPNGYMIDHVDRVRNNNKIENLRLATYQGNNRNTGAKGFTWDKGAMKWRAHIKVDNKSKFLGLYDNKICARAAYIRARKKYFGEFA